MFFRAILVETLLLCGVFYSPAIPSKGLERVSVRIQQRKSLHIPSIQLENGTRIGWFSCPTESCSSDWDKHFLAEIMFMTKVSVDDQRFDAHLNGTLVIRNVLPIYDGRYFITRVYFRNRTNKPYTYQLKINKEPPILTLVSQQIIQLYEGMDLYLEAEVRAYPDPRVSWSHNSWSDRHGRAQNRSNCNSSEILLKVPNITKSDRGDYIISAENTLGNHNLTVTVYVHDFSCPTSITPTGLSCSTSTTPTDNQGDRDYDSYKVTTYVLSALLLLAVGYIICLKRTAISSFATTICSAQVINEPNINLHV